MKTSILFSFLFMSLSFAFGKKYKTKLELTNTSSSDLKVSYQVGFALDADNGNNIYLGTLKAGAENIVFEDKIISVDRGESIFLLVDWKGSFVAVRNYRIDGKPSKILSLQISIPTARNSSNPISAGLDLEKVLSKFGSNEISSGNRYRARVNYPLSSGMGTVCGGLVMIDMSKMNEDKEFEIGDIKYMVPSYLLKTTPVKIKPEGASIIETFDFESDLEFNNSSSFPLAGSIDLGLSKANYYKTEIEVKEAGWVPLENPNNKDYVASFVAINDSETRLTNAINIKAKLDECKDCRVWTAESAFFYESILVTTSQFDRLNITTDGSVSSVVSLNGAYKRKESKDFSFSRGSTISYVALSNDVTASIKQKVNEIIEEAYLQRVVNNKEYNLDKSISQSDKEQLELGIEVDTSKSFDLENYISTDKINQIKTFSKEQLENQIKSLDAELN